MTMEAGRVKIDLATVDMLRQTITNLHVTLTNIGPKTYPVGTRWGNWDGSSYTRASARHISI